MSSTPFKWHTEWSGIILSDDNLLLPNTWTVSFEYDTVSDNMLHRDIAMQRLEFMIDEKFNTSVWTNFTNQWVSDFYNNLDVFIITLPSDPYDSLIAAVALLKAQNITKGVLDIKRCSIKSKLGYTVENIIDYEEAEEMGSAIEHKHFSEGPWFMRSDAGFTDLLMVDENEQVTIIKDTESWEKHNLDWDYYDKSDSNIMPLSGYRQQHSERWIPLVIKGGAKDNDED